MRMYLHPVEPKQNHDVTRLFYSTWWHGLRRRGLWRQVRTYCMFIGYPRSGHSLVGSLIDAHPNAVIAHELDALGYLSAGFSRDQLYSLILRRDEQFTAGGRVWGDYKYQVPRQWQGRFRNLQVIGDKKGGLSTVWLQQQPELLGKLRQAVEVPIRMIHVVRNPFDNIATIFTRKHRPTLQASAEWYFSLCDTIQDLLCTSDEGTMLTVRHEEMVEDPRSTVRRVCYFLQLEADDQYVEDCASIVFPSPRQTRFTVEWDSQTRQYVEQQMRRIEFLRGYEFGEPPAESATPAATGSQTA